MQRSVIIITFIILFCLFPAFADDSNTVDVDDKPDQLRFFAMPLIGYSSDEGLLIGVFGGVSKNEFVLYPNAYYGTNNKYAIKASGEVPLWSLTAVGNVAYREELMRVFPIPFYPGEKEYAHAQFAHTDFNINFLYKTDRNYQVGPAFYFRQAHGWEITDTNENPLGYTPERFKFAREMLTGIRYRYANTSPVRPLDGNIIELSLLFGRSESIEWDQPKLTWMYDLRLAKAYPITQSVRGYSRMNIRHQAEAAPSIRHHVGGGSTVRGQPNHFYYGRSSITARNQCHITVLKHWTCPTDMIRSILPQLPYQPVDLEFVTFIDNGTIRDPDPGTENWQRTLTGYGFGIRVVAPPSLVGYVDFATGNDGYFTIYAGAGATL